MATMQDYEKMMKEKRMTFLDSLDTVDEIPYIDRDILDGSKILLFDPSDKYRAELFKDGTGEELPSSTAYVLEMSDIPGSFYMWETGELRGRSYGGGFYFFEDDVLHGELPVYVVDNPLDMMIVKSTKKAEAVIVLSAIRESLLSFFDMWKERAEGELPPVIVRLESTKGHGTRTDMIVEAFNNTLGYKPTVSEGGTEVYEAWRENRRTIERELQDIQLKKKMAESKGNKEEMEKMEEMEENLEDELRFLDLDEVSTVYGLFQFGGVDLRSIEDEVKMAVDDERERKEAMRMEAYRYLQTATAPAMGGFLDELRQNAREYIPTGFINLDRRLGGGWEEGNLYVIGAESSIGKTSLLLQIADNLSRDGADVLFFSLEMSRRELMAKSLSRLSFERIVKERAPGSLVGWLRADGKTTEFYDNRLDSWTYYIENKGLLSDEALALNEPCMEHGEDEEEARRIVSSWRLPKSYSNILHKAHTWDEETFSFISECARQYSRDIDSVFIVEDSTAIDPMSSGRPTIDTIEKAIEQHKKNTGAEGKARPLVVCLDYLQLMKMESMETGRELSEKQAVDEAMGRLRNIASNTGAVIIALSSINRNGYNRPVHIESLKESGGVEYGADKILGMEPRGLKEPVGGANDRTIAQNIQVMKDFKEAQGRRVVKLSILKNRGGALGHVYLSNVGMFGYFSDTNETEAQGVQKTIDGTPSRKG